MRLGVTDEYSDGVSGSCVCELGLSGPQQYMYGTIILQFAVRVGRLTGFFVCSGGFRDMMCLPLFSTKSKLKIEPTLILVVVILLYCFHPFFALIRGPHCRLDA